MREHAVTLAEVVGEAAALVAGREYVVAATVDEAKATRGGAMVYGRLRDGAASLPYRCLTQSGVTGALRRHGLSLAPGFAGVFRVALDVHERWGLQLDIVGVDTATVAPAADAVDARELIGRIETEGLAGRQRSLLLQAAPPCRVGLVSSRSSQGLADVVARIEGRYEALLFEASMDGGVAAAEQVARAITQAARAGCDLIGVVRGGGDVAGMRWANDPALAQTVLECPVPVVVGVGHAADRHVLDAAAARSFVTPTAVGEWLVALQVEAHRRVEQAGDVAALEEARRRAAVAAQRAHVAEEDAARRIRVAVAASVAITAAVVLVVLRFVGVA